MNDAPVFKTVAPWRVEFGLGGQFAGGLHGGIVRFVFATEDAARTAYEVVTAAAKDKQERKNDAPTTIEIQDLTGTGSIRTEDVSYARVLNQDLWTQYELEARGSADAVLRANGAIRETATVPEVSE